MKRGRRAAIVGAGLMGRWHATYARRCGAAVAVVADVDLGAARRLASRFRGAEAMELDGERPVLPEVDVVHVCTPSSATPGLVAAALDAGRHVVAEKPVATTVAEAWRLVELAESRRRALVPVHQLPFQRGFGILHDRLESLGELVDVSYRCFTAGAGHYEEAERERVLVEILPHPASVFLALGLEAAPWRREGRATRGRDLRLAGDAGDLRLRIHVSAVARPPRHELEVAGTRGSARVDFFHGYCAFEPGPGAGRRAKILRPFRLGAGMLARAAANLAVRSLRRQPAYPGLPVLLESFYRSLDAGGVLVSGSEIVAAAELIEIATAPAP